MSNQLESQLPLRAAAPEFAPPGWVFELLADATLHQSSSEGVAYELRRSEHFSLVSAHIPQARRLNREDLAAAVYGVYVRSAELTESAGTAHAVRYWNHICHIHEPMGLEMDRYMAFNAGRHRAFEEHCGGESRFDQMIATASGVGCSGEDVVIHTLAARAPGIAVANPRQVQPFRYSRRFGPRPPCFARGTIVQLPRGLRQLLIGGTASICGEESAHPGSLSRQLGETFDNLRALLENAGKISGLGTTMQDVLDLRIYVVDRALANDALAAARAAMPRALQVQLMRADICRKDLLVEIEGRAILRSSK